VVARDVEQRFVDPGVAKIEAVLQSASRRADDGCNAEGRAAGLTAPPT
jgi:hypothetical protein